MTKTKNTSKKARLIKLIHVAKTTLCISDDDYRRILAGATGKESCADMTTEELETTFRAFKNLGFVVKHKKRLPVKDDDRGRASNEQLYYIKGLWELASREKTEHSLHRFVKRITGVEHLRFLDSWQAQKVILALRSLAVKAGYDPDGYPKKGVK